MRHAYRLVGDAEQARDVVQDGWGDIVHGLKRLNDAAAFPAWAYQIVTRRAADHIRRNQRGRNLQSTFAAEPREQLISSASIESYADRGPLLTALEKLSPDQQATMHLFYVEGFTTSEISKALSIPTGTVKTRLMHSRQRLKELLEGENRHDCHR